MKRDLAIDGTRGIAILAVVLFHVTRGFVNADWLAPSVALTFADNLAYSFHVQTFLIIAGYLAFPRAGEPGFQLVRQSSLYHAYILWSLISWGIVASVNSAVNNPVNIQNLIMLPIVPIQHFWFLLALMAGIALLYFLRKPWMLLSACLLLVAAAPWSSELLATSVAMVLLGAALRAASARPVASLPAAIICALILVGGISWTTLHADGPALTSPIRILFALSGCYVAYCCATFAGSAWVGRTLAYFGRHSLVIFLLHVIAGSGLRVILSQTVPSLNVYIAMMLVFSMSLIGPLVFERFATRFGIDGMFALRPFFSSRWGAAGLRIAPSSPAKGA